jgi:hypothetical protein
VSIAAQGADLITYAKGRQPLFEIHESHLAELICWIASSPAGNAGSLQAGLRRLAEDMKLRVAWPEPSIDLPGPERDAADLFELSYELTDAIELLMHRRGMTENEAIEEFRRIQRRRAIAAAIQADPEADVTALVTRDETPEIAEPIAGQDPSVVTPDMGVPRGNGQAGGPTVEVIPQVTVIAPIRSDEPIPVDLSRVSGPVPGWDPDTEVG